MYDKEKEAVNGIKQYVIAIVKRAIQDLRVDKTIPSRIVGILENDKYLVVVNGYKYSATNATFVDFEIGDSVWVTIPCGDFNSKFISGRRY